MGQNTSIGDVLTHVSVQLSPSNSPTPYLSCYPSASPCAAHVSVRRSRRPFRLQSPYPPRAAHPARGRHPPETSSRAHWESPRDGNKEVRLASPRRQRGGALRRRPTAPCLVPLPPADVSFPPSLIQYRVELVHRLILSNVHCPASSSCCERNRSTYSSMMRTMRRKLRRRKLDC
jgi:hypothetical protein